MKKRMAKEAMTLVLLPSCFVSCRSDVVFFRFPPSKIRQTRTIFLHHAKNIVVCGRIDCHFYNGVLVNMQYPAYTISRRCNAENYSLNYYFSIAIFMVENNCYYAGKRWLRSYRWQDQIELIRLLILNLPLYFVTRSLEHLRVSLTNTSP